MAYILTPNLDDPDRNIKSHYVEISPWFFGLGAFYLGAWAFNSYVMLGNSIGEPGSAYRFIGMALMGILAASRNERLHTGLVFASYLLMAAWLSAAVF